MKDGSEGALAIVLREAAIYREMVNVLLEALHAAYKRERYRRESHVNKDR